MVIILGENLGSPLPSETNFLYQKKIVFTGTLQMMTREKAQHLVSILNGDVQQAVTKKTDILVVGVHHQTIFETDTLSKKKSLAKKYQVEGHPISVLSEKEFFSLAVEQLEKVRNNLY